MRTPDSSTLSLVTIPTPKNPSTRGADKSVVRPDRKKATGTEDFDVHTSYLLS